MRWNTSQLDRIFRVTDGRCHLCHRDLGRSHYGKRGYSSSWCVEHSKPSALGGSDHVNNLFPSCFPCNERKGATRSAREIRAENGRVGIPLSTDARGVLVMRNIKVSTLLGACLGIVASSHVGAGFSMVVLIGMILGALVGIMLPVRTCR